MESGSPLLHDRDTPFVDEPNAGPTARGFGIWNSPQVVNAEGPDAALCGILAVAACIHLEW